MKEIKKAVILFALLSLLTGVLYPLAVTVLAQLIFPGQAGGSLMRKTDGTLVGSALIGQSFSDPSYFWSRPSATSELPYNPLASGGSNLAPTNEALIEQFAERVNHLRASGMREPFPADLVMASGSGLDPHISPEAALRQVSRVASERHMSEEKIQSLVVSHIERRQLRFLGAQRVNVLKLNVALDEL
jgi:K+-transporting ATPase ATPase C chain